MSDIEVNQEEKQFQKSEKVANNNKALTANEAMKRLDDLT